MELGMLLRACLLALAMILFLEDVEAKPKRILLLLPLSTRSENEMFYPIINALAGRGHDITTVMSDPGAPTKIQHKNVSILLPFSYTDVFDVYGDTALEYKPMDFLFFDLHLFHEYCDRTFQTEEFKEKVLAQNFDMILTSAFGGQCFYGMAHKTQAPLVLLNTFPLPNSFTWELGSYAPTSFVPFSLFPFTGVMSFWERMTNFLVDGVSIFTHTFLDVPGAERVYRKNLGDHYPSVQDIHRNVSLVLTNTDPLLTPMRPLMPDYVEVGGLHCLPPKPLPKDMEDIVSGSKDGFIFFSLGTVATDKTLPDESVQKLMRVFSRLKQRVLWKWGSRVISGLDVAPNVYMRKFFPQQDLLGHKNIRLFISHGGLFGSMEAVYHGVPVLGMPIFFDQFANVKRAVQNGYALELDIRNFGEEELETAIRRMLEEPRFKERMAEASAIFKDQPHTPLERAVFKIEQILRHPKILEYRSSPARGLNLFQMHSLDVIVVLSLVLLTFVVTLAFIVTVIVRKLKGSPRGSSRPSTSAQKKKK